MKENLLAVNSACQEKSERERGEKLAHFLCHHIGASSAAAAAPVPCLRQRCAACGFLNPVHPASSHVSSRSEIARASDSENNARTV
ncbi:hypothetical protein EYF80_004895 [Liparis tanakae]|uniref:Uncharacterized protein n=1 Tax=Liparis tanakae TaxID=230148 RepID=A0A4Z2J3T4_9TELE|nr:hypothetical protein EYF80_004895 [Liparis tanakae]